MDTITTKKDTETQQFAHRILADLLSKPRTSAMVLALSGDLGAGKTTFVQGLAQHLKIQEPITSPTFILANTYSISSSNQLKKLTHIDCYRFDSAGDADILQFEELCKDPERLVCIEWPERIAELLPEDAVWIEFEYGEKEDERIIKITNNQITPQLSSRT